MNCPQCSKPMDLKAEELIMAKHERTETTTLQDVVVLERSDRAQDIIAALERIPDSAIFDGVVVKCEGPGVPDRVELQFVRITQKKSPER